MTQGPIARVNTQGAVDLAALASAKHNQQQAERALANAPAGLVIDVTTATFERDVIEQSMTVPVVLDLWATWCGPCKTLSPLLEKLAVEYGGRWVLAKVDVDAEQAIAQAFQVQSIPSVFAVIKGQPIPLFQGALPESQLRQYLDELLAAAQQAGVSGQIAGGAEAAAAIAEPESDPRFEAAFDAIEAADWEGAEAAYRLVLDTDPLDQEAQAGLALVGMYRRASASDVVEPAVTDQDLLMAADHAGLAGRWSEAFELVLEVVRRSSGSERDVARARLLELFTVAGDDPAVPAARTALASALF